MNETPAVQPRTDQAARSLRQEIEHGRFAGHTVLPGERDLSRLLGVSRTTLRRALKSLLRDGVLGHRQGYGTFPIGAAPATYTTQRAAEPRVGPIRGPGQDLLDRNQATGIFSVETSRSLPTPDEAMALDVTPLAIVFRSTRTLWLAQTLVGIERMTLAKSDEPPGKPARPGHAIEWPNVPVDRSVRRMRPGNRPLSIDPGTPLDDTTGIVIEERGFGEGGRCLVFWQLWQPLRAFDSLSALTAS